MVGKLLKTRRIKLKFTQEFVADYLGVSRQTLSYWENDRINESILIFLKLLALLKIYDLKEIIEGSHR